MAEVLPVTTSARALAYRVATAEIGIYFRLRTKLCTSSSCVSGDHARADFLFREFDRELR